MPDEFILTTDFYIKRIHPAGRKKMPAAIVTVLRKDRTVHNNKWKCATDKYK